MSGFARRLVRIREGGSSSLLYPANAGRAVMSEIVAAVMTCLAAIISFNVRAFGGRCKTVLESAMKLLVPLILLFAAPLTAAELAEYQDLIYLREGEVARYQVLIDYGIAPDATIHVFARGFDSPPRVRILDPDDGELKERHDTSGDWIISFSYRASRVRGELYVELENAYHNHTSDYEITIRVVAEDATGATADVSFEKTYYRGGFYDNTGHVHCSAMNMTRPALPFALLALTVALVRARRRPTRALVD